MRRLLFITYTWPPHAGSGVFRPAKFAKYLPSFGWQPMVVCADRWASEYTDDSLMGEVSRLKSIDIMDLGIKRLVRWNRHLSVLANVLAFPDTAALWARDVRQFLPAWIETYKPDAVWTTAPPYSAHLVGQWVKRKYGIPWFADLREQWAGDITRPMPPGYRAAHRWLERRTLADADRICCLSVPRMHEIQARVGGDADRYLVITNGWDDEAQGGPPHKHERFTMTYTGVFTKRRRPDTFCRAVQWLVESGMLEPDAIRVRFVGPRLDRYVPERPYFECVGQASHEAVLDAYREADVLLLLLDPTPENAGRYSGKLLEYIAANRPILAIGPRGGVAEALLDETATGAMVGDNVEQIGYAILRLYRQWREGTTLRPDHQAIGRYHRRYLTQKLALELRKICHE